jgi:YD repeat-containing protein
MLNKSTLNLCCFLIALQAVIIPRLLQGQVSTDVTYDGYLKKSRSFAVLDENMFGDKVSLQDGAMSFVQDDIVLTTNSELRVMLGRKTFTGKPAATPQFQVFGDWDLNVPYMMATYDTRDGWNANFLAGGNTGRCRSGAIAPKERQGPWPYYYTQPIYAHMYWNGVQINIPGVGQEQMLKLNPGQVLPADGKTYYATTKSAWKVGCLDAVQNDTGEGFTVKTNDGITYYFDWMAKRKNYDLTDGAAGVEGSNYSWHLLAPLTDVYLYASKAVDRFGNTVTYTYDAANPQRIKAIQSSDGVRLDVQYNSDGLIAMVTSGNRTWSYTYQGRQLKSLALPDNSKWTFSGNFDLLSLGPGTSKFWSDGCGQNAGDFNAYGPVNPSLLATVNITHPSGARGEFTLRPLYHGTNNTPGGCGLFGSAQTILWYGTYGVPSASGVESIYSKKISGPGMADRTWNYAYAPSWTFDTQCNNGCASTSKTTVTTADGVVRRYTYGNDYKSNLGQLLAETVEKNGIVLRNTTHTYLTSATGQPFPDNSGDIAKANGVADLYGNPFKFKNRPGKTTSITQEGSTFTTNVTSFDQFVRPTSKQISNSLGYSKTDATEYFDDTARWVLGQVKRSINANTNMIPSETLYNAQSLPWKLYAFGKLQSTVSYNADGTLANVTDGRGNVIALSDWKRGIPGTIQFPRSAESPTGDTQKARVDDNGWILDVTNELGAKTCYDYDAMGRIKSIIYPSEATLGVCDSSRWSPASFSFQQINVDEHGLPPGHWRASHYEGNRHINSYYDAMWRPVLEETLDYADIAGTLSQVVKKYDNSGHLIFQSYPTRNVGNFADITQGARAFYDGLDRAMKTEQDSELGVLSATIEYLSGLRTRVTNAREQVFTTSFMAFDQPDYELAISSIQPEGKVIQIDRHPQFGWPLRLIQRSADYSVQQVRSYVYDGAAQNHRARNRRDGDGL